MDMRNKYVIVSEPEGGATYFYNNKCEGYWLALQGTLFPTEAAASECFIGLLKW